MKVPIRFEPETGMEYEGHPAVRFHTPLDRSVARFPNLLDRSLARSLGKPGPTS